jgi:nucleoside phosphorylase
MSDTQGVDSPPLLIITPTLPEYRAVQAGLAHLPARNGVEVVSCGMGPQAAAALGRRLEQEQRAYRGAALLGWAGGLAENLAAGDIVVASVAVNEAGQCAPCLAIPLPGAHCGPMLTVATPLVTAAGKVAARTTGALAVEMEGYPLAEWAARRGLPFVHARVILDPCHENLPDLAGGLDGTSRVRPARLAWRLTTRPGLLLSLLRLVRKTQTLAPQLGGLARTLALHAWFSALPDEPQPG